MHKRSVQFLIAEKTREVEVKKDQERYRAFSSIAKYIQDLLALIILVLIFHISETRHLLL